MNKNNSVISRLLGSTPRARMLRLAAATAGFAALSLTVARGGHAGPDANVPEAIDDVQCLRKIALDLTYAGPSREDIAAVKDGSASLADMADKYMSTPEFEQIVFDWYRGEFPPTELTEEIGGIDHEEPSRIARQIVLGDIDYRQLMTADFTVTPEGEVVDAANGPGAGVLSTRHYMSAYAGSFRRNWAGHFLQQWTPIVLQAVTLPPEADPEDLTPDTLMTDPACASCHASEIYGIDYLAPFSFCYDGSGAFVADCAVNIDGRFLTKTGTSLEDLGEIVSDSNEFMSNSVNFFLSKLFGRALAHQEAEFYVNQVTRFRASDYKAKTLIKNIVTSDAYCAQ